MLVWGMLKSHYDDVINYACTVHVAYVGVSGRDDVRTGSYSRTYERSENQPVRAAAVRRSSRREGEAPAAVTGPVRRGPAVDVCPPWLGVLRLAPPRLSRRNLSLYPGSGSATHVQRLRPAARRAAAPATVCFTAYTSTSHPDNKCSQS